MNYREDEIHLHNKGLTKEEVEEFQQIFFRINDNHISFQDAKWFGIKFIDMILPVLLFSNTEKGE